MSESDNSGDKTLTVAPSKTLHLKQRPNEQGMVRQSFSHGRSKVVVVEKVKRRAPGHVEPAKAAPAAPAAPATPAPQPKAEPARPAAPRSGSGVVLRALTDDEREARARALVDARSREEEDRRRAEIEAKARAERDAQDKVERAAADTRKREEEERLAREAESKRKSEEEARRRLPQENAEPAAAQTSASPGRTGPAETTIKRAPVRTIGGFAPPTPPRPSPSRGGEKNRGRLTVTTAHLLSRFRPGNVAVWLCTGRGDHGLAAYGSCDIPRMRAESTLGLVGREVCPELPLEPVALVFERALDMVVAPPPGGGVLPGRRGMLASVSHRGERIGAVMVLQDESAPFPANAAETLGALAGVVGEHVDRITRIVMGRSSHWPNGASGAD